jgi:hypothetical protein
MQTALEGQQITVRPATPNEVTLILSFIHKKAQFDRNMRGLLMRATLGDSAFTIG